MACLDDPHLQVRLHHILNAANGGLLKLLHSGRPLRLETLFFLAIMAAPSAPTVSGFSGTDTSLPGSDAMARTTPAFLATPPDMAIFRSAYWSVVRLTREIVKKTPYPFS